MRTAVVGVALALAGVLAGVLSAQALGQVDLPVTISVPTVSLPVPTTPAPPTPPPVPPVPVPPPPAVTAPTPPAPIPLPVAPAPSPSPSPGSPPASAPSGASGYGASSGSASTRGGSDNRRRPAASRAGKARVTGIRARPARTERGGTRKRAARITFTLNAAARVVFVVRGPAPSCGIAGRFKVRGSRGVNHVRFTGRLGRRNLPYGTYRITARTSGRKPSRAVVVVLGDRGGASGFTCGAAGSQASIFQSVVGTFSNGTTGNGGGDIGGGSAAAGASASAAGGTGTRATGAIPDGKAEKRDSGVLPAVSEKLGEIPEALPRPSIPEASASPHWIIGAGALLLLALSALALLVYVIRFIRKPHTT